MGIIICNTFKMMTYGYRVSNYKALPSKFKVTCILPPSPRAKNRKATIQQLLLTGSKIDRRKVCNASGIIRLYDFYDIEALLLETIGHLENKNTKKSALITEKVYSLSLPCSRTPFGSTFLSLSHFKRLYVERNEY